MVPVAGISSRIPSTSTLTFKVFAVPLALVIVLASLAIFSSGLAVNALQEEIRDSTTALAVALSTGIDRGLYLKFHEMHVVAMGQVMREALASSNAIFDAMEDPDEYIDTIDVEWSSTPLNETTPLMDEILANPLSRNLSERLDLHYETVHGIDIYSELLVTNTYGAIVAMTSRSSDYRQDDETWWQVARDEGGYIGDVEFDESTGIWGVAVCIPVTDYDDAFAGVMKGFVDIVSVVYESGTISSPFATTETKVLSSDGHQLFSSRAFLMMDDLSDAEYFTKAVGDEGSFVAVEGERERLFSYYRSTGYMTYAGHGWVVLVSYDAAEVMRPVANLRTNIMLAAGILVASGLVASVLFSRSITVPMRRLADTASRLSEGDLEARAGFDREDEIGALARAFDHMAEELGTLYHGLEDKVKERTEDLEKANRKLSILGSITRHDTLNQMSVLAGWLGLAKETVTNEAAREYLDKAMGASEKIGSYLEFSREYEKIGVKTPEWLSLSESFVSSAYGMETRGIEMVDDTKGYEVLADPMFPKVLRNLMENSLKHGRNVSRINISAEETPDGLLIAYEDDGVGISKERKSAIFESRTAHGLYLASEILAITEIQIQEVGEPGEGVRFEMLVPPSRYRSVQVKRSR